MEQASNTHFEELVLFRERSVIHYITLTVTSPFFSCFTISKNSIVDFLGKDVSDPPMRSAQEQNIFKIIALKISSSSGSIVATKMMT